MVKNATSYSGNGLRDWLVQRVTAVILAAYTFFIMGFILVRQDITYSSWESLFSNMSMKVATLLALLALVLHAWIGMWTIFTDYLKPVVLRILVEVIVIIALVWYFVWGVFLLWSV